MKELYKGIYKIFDAAPTTALHTALGGRLYPHEAPESATYPFGIYALVTDMPAYVFGGNYDTSIFTVQFSLYSQKSSATEVLNAYENLKTLYDGCTLTVTGYSFLSCIRENSIFYRHPEDNVWVHHTDYEIMIATS